MLPGIDGFECIRQLRRHDDVPIVVVSARDDTHDIVAALEAGADDYVVKPVAVKELSARLRALRRRARARRPAAVPALVFGDLEIMPEAGEVRLRGRAGGGDPHRVPAAVRAGRARRPGAVRASSCCNGCGSTTIGDERLVDVHVGRLRQKIEDDPRRTRGTWSRSAAWATSCSDETGRACAPGSPPRSPSARCCCPRRWPACPTS